MYTHTYIYIYIYIYIYQNLNLCICMCMCVIYVLKIWIKHRFRTLVYFYMKDPNSQCPQLKWLIPWLAIL